MRIAFAHREYVLDFDTLEAAEKYVRKNSRNGWFFSEIVEQNLHERYWTVTVRKPLGKYNPGW